jgi:3-methyladenine DNA glycosylase AlkD
MSAVRRTDVNAVIARLKRLGTKANREGMARYGLPSERTFGVSVATLQREAKTLGKDHDLALALWDAAWYEGRMLAAFVDDPASVTPAQMDAWCRDFDNWGICDTVCFHLFDRTPHAWKKVAVWCRRRAEFEKRAGFALLASLALHDKKADDENFLRFLPVIQKAASDDRNFAKKGVSWALRLIGHRNRALHEAAMDLSRTLAASTDRATRWVGKDALRDLTRPAVTRKVAARTK